MGVEAVADGVTFPSNSVLWLESDGGGAATRCVDDAGAGPAAVVRGGSLEASHELLFAYSRQLRDTSRGLVRQATGLIEDSRALADAIGGRQRASVLGRLARLRGGRDLGSADAPIHLVRTRIADGTLPRRDPEKTWFGHGTNRACDACLLPVSREQIEVEADFDGAPTIRLHSSCFHIWQVERARSD